MAAKKKSKAKAKAAPKAKKAAPKKAAKRAAPKQKAASKKAAPKQAAPKQAAPKQAAPKHVAAKKAAPAQRSNVVQKAASDMGAYKGANLDHHPVSKRDIDAVAREGLRGDGEILHVEEAEFMPCRLVDHGEGRFSLCFDDFRMPALALFEERGLQGGGYTWEAVVSSLVKLRRPDLEPDLTYDSESGMFVALGARESLRVVAKLIQQAIASDSMLQQAVDAADPDRLE